MPAATPTFADLIDATKAANLVGVSIYTLHRWISAGKLRAWKVGGRRRVLLAELQDLIVPITPRQAPPEPAASMTKAQTRAVLSQLYPHQYGAAKG